MAAVSLRLDIMLALLVLHLRSRPGPGSLSTLMAHLFLVLMRSQMAVDTT